MRAGIFEIQNTFTQANKKKTSKKKLILRKGIVKQMPLKKNDPW